MSKKKALGGATRNARKHRQHHGHAKGRACTLALARLAAWAGQTDFHIATGLDTPVIIFVYLWRALGLLSRAQKAWAPDDCPRYSC